MKVKRSVNTKKRYIHSDIYVYYVKKDNKIKNCILCILTRKFLKCTEIKIIKIKYSFNYSSSSSFTFCGSVGSPTG